MRARLEFISRAGYGFWLKNREKFSVIDKRGGILEEAIKNLIFSVAHDMERGIDKLWEAIEVDYEEESTLVAEYLLRDAMLIQAQAYAFHFNLLGLWFDHNATLDSHSNWIKEEIVDELCALKDISARFASDLKQDVRDFKRTIVSLERAYLAELEQCERELKAAEDKQKAERDDKSAPR